MICEKMTTPSSRTTKIGGGYTTSHKVFVICKADPPSCFTCKIYILCVVPFLHKRGHMTVGCLPWGIFLCATNNTWFQNSEKYHLNQSGLLRISRNWPVKPLLFFGGSSHYKVHDAIIQYPDWQQDDTTDACMNCCC